MAVLELVERPDAAAPEPVKEAPKTRAPKPKPKKEAKDAAGKGDAKPKRDGGRSEEKRVSAKTQEGRPGPDRGAEEDGRLVPDSYQIPGTAGADRSAGRFVFAA